MQRHRCGGRRGEGEHYGGAIVVKNSLILRNTIASCFCNTICNMLPHKLKSQSDYIYEWLLPPGNYHGHGEKHTTFVPPFSQTRIGSCQIVFNGEVLIAMRFNHHSHWHRRGWTIKRHLQLATCTLLPLFSKGGTRLVLGGQNLHFTQMSLISGEKQWHRVLVDPIVSWKFIYK